MAKLHQIWNKLQSVLMRRNGECMSDSDEPMPMPVEVRDEMRRRVQEAREGRVMSLAEARRRSQRAEEERLDLFPISTAPGFR